MRSIGKIKIDVRTLIVSAIIVVFLEGISLIFGFDAYPIALILSLSVLTAFLIIVVVLIVRQRLERQQSLSIKENLPENGVPVRKVYVNELYKIEYEKIAELTHEEELFVKKNSGSNLGKLKSAPEGPTYYTYDDMLDTARVLSFGQENVKFAGLIDTLEKELDKPGGYNTGWMEFVFDHEKKFGPINANSSTALYKIVFKHIADLTEEETEVMVAPYFGVSMFVLDSSPMGVLYMDKTHLEAFVNMFGEQKFERLVKLLKEEMDKSGICISDCIELVTSYRWLS